MRPLQPRSIFERLLPIAALAVGWATMGADSCVAVGPTGDSGMGCTISSLSFPQVLDAGAFAVDPSLLWVIKPTTQGVFVLVLEGTPASGVVPSGEEIDGGCQGGALEVFEPDAGWLTAEATLTVLDGGTLPDGGGDAGPVFAADLSDVLINFPDGGSHGTPDLSLSFAITR